MHSHGVAWVKNKNDYVRILVMMDVVIEMIVIMVIMCGSDDGCFVMAMMRMRVAMIRAMVILIIV